MPQQTLYDEIPYTSFPHSPSHPDQLATVAFLHGLDPPRVADCRVLELGCGAGANLLGMAYGLPRARLIGLDLANSAIEQARTDARAVYTDYKSIQNMIDRLVTPQVYTWSENIFGQFNAVSAVAKVGATIMACQWASMSPGIRTLPPPAMIVGLAFGSTAMSAADTLAMMLPLISTFDAALTVPLLPSKTRTF